MVLVRGLIEQPEERKMEIEIITREMIKPASPTPDHLRIYKISLLDQIIPPVYAPAVLYFAPDSTCSNAGQESTSQRIQLLKDSLALTLTRFYPLAGVVRDALSVDCNDEGLTFFVAKVKGQLSELLEHPDVQLINKILPSEFTWNKVAGPGANIGTIQVNRFACGGLAICVILAHHIADVTTLCTFLRAWAATARGSSEVIRPDFTAQSVFPQKVAMPKESHLFYNLQKFLSRGKFVTRRYVFDASSISTLKARSMISIDKQPTRIEVVSSFIWKCFMAAAAGKPGADHKPCLVTQAVDLRRRGDPAFPASGFGNFLWLAAVHCTNPMEKDLKYLVNEVKGAMRRIDKEFVKSLQGDRGYDENVEEFRQGIPEQADWFSLSSWSKIGLYDIDFGWGRPVWLSGFVSGDSDTVLPNSATLVDTRSGDGIEAWVILDEKYVAGFEKNEELKIYACLNPSVL